MSESFGRRLRVRHHRLRDGPRLGPVRAPAAPVVARVGEVVVDEAYLGALGVGAGKGDEPVVVELPVRDGDERLVPAPVVPAEHPLGRLLRGEELEDALDVGGVRQALVVLVADDAVEEARRRELLAVADDDGLLPTEERAERVDGLDLARLVEDDEVELTAPGGR